MQVRSSISNPRPGAASFGRAQVTSESVSTQPMMARDQVTLSSTESPVSGRILDWTTVSGIGGALVGGLVFGVEGALIGGAVGALAAYTATKAQEEDRSAREHASPSRAALEREISISAWASADSLAKLDRHRS